MAAATTHQKHSRKSKSTRARDGLRCDVLVGGMDDRDERTPTDTEKN